MAIIFNGEGFTRDQEHDLRQTLKVVGTKVRSFPLPWDLASRLNPRLAKNGEPVYMTYRGYEGECGEGSKSYTFGSNQIYLCATAFTASNGGKRRLGSILLHELIHTCGGTELDAEAYENALFQGEGATPPDSRDYEEFREDDFRGVWVWMNEQTREVRDLEGHYVFTFPQP